MTCPHCAAIPTTELTKRTQLGYRIFRCSACRRQFNECTHRGFEFTHEAVREWEARFALLFTQQLRAKRKGQVGRSWYVDETYIRVAGRWTYLYRAIDREVNLVDSMLSEHRDMPSAKRFFKAALELAGQTPERVTTDGQDS